MSSYRPIALTSNIRKLLEQPIVNRLSWWLEAKSILSPRQAVFRKRRCTNDQCLRLFQFVSDGFQSTNKERTVLMLFDYSKAYYTVCRTDLLQKMLDIRVLLRFVQWTTAWLTNRIARVQLNGVTGRCRTFKDGLPQGSVLSLLLFVLNINDLLGIFSESTMVSAYADDLAIAFRGRKKEDVALRMPAKVDKVVSWSQQACLTLNAAKCEVAFFSLDNAEAQWRPQITINGVPPSCTPLPTFLGVTYNRRMTFGTQVKKVCQKMLRRTNLLRVVGGTTWGWQKHDLRTVYISTQRSVAEYAAAAWTPWLTSSNIEKLERIQLQAARSITHHVRSTPTEAVLYEADLPRLEHRFNTLCVLQANKWNILDVEDPQRVVLNDSVRLRLRRPDWRTTVLSALSSLGLLTYHPGDDTPPRHDPPLSRPSPAPTAMTDVSMSMSRDQQLAATMAAIEYIGPTDIQVYTDGSTHEGTTDGGAGMVAMSGEDIIERWHAPTGRWSSSYQAEKSAMVRAISLLDEYKNWQLTLVLCDSKSLVETLANSNQHDGDVHRIQSAIADLCKKKKVLILWVPGHCKLRGNELADLEAKLGSEVAQPSIPLDSSTRAALIRREERQSSLTHPRLTALCMTRPQEEEESLLQKADRTDLIRFHCGHHPHLRRWQHMTGMSETDSCRLCAEEEELSEHLWL